MKPEWFIAGRIGLTDGEEQRFSQPIVKITVLAIALGITVMLVSLAVLRGFQEEITLKVAGFGAHVNIAATDANNFIEVKPVLRDQPFYTSIKNIAGVKNVQAYIQKPAIIKTDENIEGVVLKGIGTDYDWSYFKDKVIAGRLPEIKDTGRSTDIMISDHLAHKLNYKVNDKLFSYFIQQPPRARKFNICGIYKTGLEEFDSRYAFVDIAQLQKLNDWGRDSVAGFEVVLHDFKDVDNMMPAISNEVSFDFMVQTIHELYPQLFDWLKLQDMNVIVILIIMVMVCIINMVTSILILILEKTNMIGILKAMGAGNWMIRKIFLINALRIIGKGLLYGNLIGLGLCALQHYFHLVPLDEASYYVAWVPVKMELLPILAVNAGTLLICLLMMVVPSFIVTRIHPINAIRFQ